MNPKIISSFSNRKSELAFSPKNISEEVLYSLFDAARWAPSAFNEQPWRFHFALRSNAKGFNQALNLLALGNQEWATNASAIIFSAARITLSANQKDNYYALHDTGMATANLVLQATNMGLSTHIMGGFDKEKSRILLKIDENYVPVAAIAVGYKGNINDLGEHNRKRILSPRLRMEVNEFTRSL